MVVVNGGAVRSHIVEAPEVEAADFVGAELFGQGDGAQGDAAAAAELLDQALVEHFGAIKGMPIDELVAARQAKFRNMAQFYTA